MCFHCACASLPSYVNCNCTAAVTHLRSCLVRQRSDMSGRLGASCAALLTFLLVLCTINGVTSQTTDCSELPTNSELENLIALVFKESDAAADHIINVMEVNYVCLVSGAFRGTYRGISAVIRYGALSLTYCSLSSLVWSEGRLCVGECSGQQRSSSDPTLLHVYIIHQQSHNLPCVSCHNCV